MLKIPRPAGDQAFECGVGEKEAPESLTAFGQRNRFSLQLWDLQKVPLTGEEAVAQRAAPCLRSTLISHAP